MSKTFLMTGHTGPQNFLLYNIFILWYCIWNVTVVYKSTKVSTLTVLFRISRFHY